MINCLKIDNDISIFKPRILSFFGKMPYTKKTKTKTLVQMYFSCPNS